MVVTVQHVQIHVVEDSIGVVVILVRPVDPVPVAKFRPVDVQENQIEHVLHQHTHVPVPVVLERQVLLLDVQDVHHAMVHIIYLEVLAWQDQYTRVLVPVVLEVQVILLDVPDVHHAMVHILYLEVLAWQKLYTRVLVQMVLEVQAILLDVRVAHHVMVDFI